MINTIASVNILACLVLTPLVYFALWRRKTVAVITAVILPVTVSNILIWVFVPLQELGALYGLAAAFWIIVDMVLSGFVLFVIEVIVDRMSGRIK